MFTPRMTFRRGEEIKCKAFVPYQEDKMCVERRQLICVAHSLIALDADVAGSKLAIDLTCIRGLQGLVMSLILYAFRLNCEKIIDSY